MPFKTPYIMARIKRGAIREITSRRAKVVMVVSDDSEENLVQTIDVSIPTIEGQPIPSPNNMTLPLKVVKANGNKRFVFRDLVFSDSPVNFSYTVTSVMKDINNKQVGDPLTMELVVEDDGDQRIRAVRLHQKTATTFQLKVVIVGDNEDNVASIDVIFSDYSGSEPIPTELSLNSPIIKNGKKIFKNNTLTFDDPTAAIDEIYYLIIDLKDSNGLSIGSSENEVVVVGLDDI